MKVSQNGWPLIDSNQLDNSPIPGTDVSPVPGLRQGDVATLLRWVGQQFNNRVAGLYNPGCWGWNAPTPIPGTNIYSNHCSGTAIDFNAPTFPWTVDRMTDDQKNACRTIVEATQGVVVWGGDFTTKIDQMHFEINGDSDDVARIVKKIQGDTMGLTKEAGEKLVGLAFGRESTPGDSFIGQDANQKIMEYDGSKERAAYWDRYNPTRVQALEKTIADLTKQINDLKSGSASEDSKNLRSIKDGLGIK